MAIRDDDDLVHGEALIQELSDYHGPEERKHALESVWDCLDRLIDRGRENDALALVDRLLAELLDSEPEEALRGSSDEEIAYTMLRRSAVLRELDRIPEAVAQCDDLLRRYGKSIERRYVANALYRKGSDLLSLGRWPEALAAFDDLIAQERDVFDDDRKWLAFARAERGEALEGLGDEAGAAEAYDDAITALTNDVGDPEVLATVQWAMASRGRLLARLGRTEEAIALFDELIAIPEPAALRSVADVYYRKAYWFVELNKFEQAIATADAAVQRFGASDDADIRVCVVGCLNEKIYALKRLGRKDAAAFVAEQLVERFAADPDPDIERAVGPHAHRLGRSQSRLKFFDHG
jgi:tetratricopeptide (TPR) repeat protein